MMYLFKVILNNKRIPGAVLAAAVLVTPAVASAASAHVSASVNIRSGPGLITRGLRRFRRERP